MTCLGIIGGSGLEQFPELEVVQSINQETPWGMPSAALIKGRLAGNDVVFLSRHGEAHTIAPHRINYRANLSALQLQGVKAIIAVNAVGGIDPEMRPADLVIPKQLIDYTHGRESSFFDGQQQALQHIDFSYPFSDNLRQLIVRTAIDSGIMVHAHGVYGVAQGPRLETSAEIQRMARDGCDIVGMTAMPEAVLARELDIPYASLAVVVNAAAGLSEQVICIDEIERVMQQRMVDVRRLLGLVVEQYIDPRAD